MELIPEITRLSAAVDEVVEPVRFSTAQGGISDFPPRAGALLWCAASVDVAAEFPSLARALAFEPLEQESMECSDLVVELVDDHGTWRARDLQLEGEALGEVLAALGDPAWAAAAQALVGAPVHECTARLPGLLLRVLALGRAPLC